MQHNLKTHPEPFLAIFDGRKRYEFRKDDREPRYEVGDVLVLSEWSPDTAAYTGRSIQVAVTYIMRGPAYGIPDGFCCMSLACERLFGFDKADDCCGYSE